MSCTVGRGEAAYLPVRPRADRDMTIPFGQALQSRPFHCPVHVGPHAATIPEGRSTPIPRSSIPETLVLRRPSHVSAGLHLRADLPAADTHLTGGTAQGAECADCSTGFLQ